MIAHLRGKVLDMAGSMVTLEAAGVGYELCCSAACFERLQEGVEAALVVYTEVREDAIRLFGFNDRLEKQVFSLLLRVKGIGAKLAMTLISSLDKRELLKLIAAGDATSLQSVKGIGRKTAERILLELRDRVAEVVQEAQSERGATTVTSPSGGAWMDATEALVALGFSRAEAERAVREVRQAGGTAMQDAGQIVKDALKYV